MSNPYFDVLIIDAKAFLDKLKALKAIVDTNPKSIESSICGSVPLTLFTLLKINVSWTNWPEYSGDPHYPVATGVYKNNPNTGPHYQFYKTKYFFNPNSHYGQARTRLLNWLIEQVENRITELEKQNV